MATFKQMQIISQPIQKSLERLKIQINEIQAASLKASAEHDNITLLAPTGSGKTLAFLFPLLNLLKPDTGHVQVLILAPSRELAMQIEQVFRSLGSGCKVSCCYGGHPMKIEKNNLINAPAVIIGTPGRIADHLRRGNFSPDGLHTLVLDEFDKSLELGFEEEMNFIIAQLGYLKKRMLTSATSMDKNIPLFEGRISFFELNYLKETLPPRLKVKIVRANGKDKLDALLHLLCEVGNDATLVFCNHREAVDRISELLDLQGMDHDVFHGGLKQEEREKALTKFRNGSFRILITTDLASRGLDIPEIQSVVHYQLAITQDAFIHRNGRTARMYAHGNAYLLMAENDTLPPYLNETPEFVEFTEKLKLPPKPKWTTVYIGGGKKDKINKVDIVGLLLQKGGLEKDDVGLIEVHDHASYVAVNRSKATQTVQLLKNEKIKKQNVKIELSR
ncbi:MAG TPA: DEAD/DEAH box helicase [Cytophagaceae bacterium]|nr:DEAD/DEAH box helicase [Cytophagaceae bacterium]